VPDRYTDLLAEDGREPEMEPADLDDAASDLVRPAVVLD